VTLLRAHGQTRALAPDAGDRLLRLRDEHQSPILHRKETFLPPGHEFVAKFARLTRQEEKHGLLDETATIGTREGWERRLAERGFTVRGHRLVRRRGDHEADEKGEEVEPRN